MSASDVRAEERRRESPSGWHYYALYRQSPKKWYNKYVLGLKPAKTSPPLLFGGAMHDAFAVYYSNNGSLPMTQDRFRRFMVDRKDEYADPAKYLEDFNRGPKMLEVFDEKIGKDDFQRYDIIETEKGYEVPVGPPGQELMFTVRPDRVFRNKTSGVYVVMESKTTGWSIDGMFKNTERGGQVTSYIWALRKMHPEWDVQGCYIDVIYNRKSVFDAARPGMAFRSKYDLGIFEMSLYGTIVEVTQKYLALQTTPWPFLFPCTCDNSQFECEYANICSSAIGPDEIPPGFVKDPWTKEMTEVMKKTQTFTLENMK